MDRSRPDQGWRAMAMAVALFAITLMAMQRSSEFIYYQF